MSLQRLFVLLAIHHLLCPLFFEFHVGPIHWDRCHTIRNALVGVYAGHVVSLHQGSNRQFAFQYRKVLANTVARSLQKGNVLVRVLYDWGGTPTKRSGTNSSGLSQYCSNWCITYGTTYKTPPPMVQPSQVLFKFAKCRAVVPGEYKRNTSLRTASKYSQFCKSL
jgi:hypothetical protein